MRNINGAARYAVFPTPLLRHLIKTVVPETGYKQQVALGKEIMLGPLCLYVLDSIAHQLNVSGLFAFSY